MEISVALLYNGQPSFGELLHVMARGEFEVYGLAPGFVDPKSDRMLQNPETWWYYSLATRQHISFRRETLMMLADKLGLRLHTNGWFLGNNFDGHDVSILFPFVSTTPTPLARRHWIGIAP